MMVQCLKKSLTVASLARLKPYQAQYMFECILEYALLMYKTITRQATIDSVATIETKTLRANLNNLPAYAPSVNGNVDIINLFFDIPTTPRSLQGEILMMTPLPICSMLTSQSPTTTSSSTFPRSKMTTTAETWATTSHTRS
jgi:hypothetical protein